MLCRRDGTVNSLVNQQCSDEYSMFQVFCAEEFSATGECGDLLLFDIDCDEHRATCELICSGDVRNLDRQCGPQVQPFCVSDILPVLLCTCDILPVLLCTCDILPVLLCTCDILPYCLCCYVHVAYCLCCYVHVAYCLCCYVHKYIIMSNA